MTDTETLWQEITVAALLGTQRQPFRPPLIGGELGAVLDKLQPARGAMQDAAQPANADSESYLLRAAAITAVHRRAGRLPVLAAPIFPAPCPEDRLPRVSPQAGYCLEQILNSSKFDLLPEWIELAAAHQQRVPEDYLALLLDQQRVIKPLRRALLPVLGERGRWLAAQNPDWRGFSTDLDERIWSEGQRSERLAFLTDLRAENPNQAREMLAATWAQETPAERIAFLETLAEGLSMTDEPFLEGVLDDRRKDVRQAAAALLAHLPESHYAQRMIERAKNLLRWKSGLLRSTLEVTLPETCDASMVRDGIDDHKTSGIGEKASWLAQILGCVPPSIWSKTWNKHPSQILDLIHKHEWDVSLLTGVTRAALLHQDTAWLAALMEDLPHGEIKQIIELFPRMPAVLKENQVLAFLREYPSLSYEQTASICLAACRHRWSTELTQAVTTAICLTLQKGDLHPWRWEKLLRDIPPFFHPDLLEPCVERIGAALKKKEAGDPSVRHLLSVLEFRLTMRKAFPNRG